MVPKDMMSNMPFLRGVSFNARTGRLPRMVALVAALLVGRMPPLRLSFRGIGRISRGGNRGGSSRLWHRLGANMVVVELAIAVVLLAGAGLLGRACIVCCTCRWALIQIVSPLSK